MNVIFGIKKTTEQQTDPKRIQNTLAYLVQTEHTMVIRSQSHTISEAMHCNVILLSYLNFKSKLFHVLNVTLEKTFYQKDQKDVYKVAFIFSYTYQNLL